MTEDKKEMIFTGKFWTAGTGTLVVSIGKNIQEFYGLKQNDLITLEVRGVHIKTINSSEEKEDKKKLNHSQTEGSEKKPKFNIK